VADKLRVGAIALGIQGAVLLALGGALVAGVCASRCVVGQKREYRVYPARFRAQAPAWAADDLAKVAFPRESYSIFDPALTREVAEAYLASCWVADVRRVAKCLPNQLLVELDLREPAAFVRQPSGAIAVDLRGVHLPLAPHLWDHRARPLPTLIGVESAPPAPGHVWDDPHLRAGVGLLRTLAEEPDLLEQVAVVDVTNATGKLRPRESRIDFLTQRWGARLLVHWGCCPDDRRSLDPHVDMKMSMLRRYVGRPLAIGEGTATLDLRFPDCDAIIRP